MRKAAASKSEKDDNVRRDVCLVYKIPEAGALLGLDRNASYDAANRGDFGRLIILGKLKRVSKAVFHRKFELLTG